MSRDEGVEAYDFQRFLALIKLFQPSQPKIMSLERFFYGQEMFFQGADFRGLSMVIAITQCVLALPYTPKFVLEILSRAACWSHTDSGSRMEAPDALR